MTRRTFRGRVATAAAAAGALVVLAPAAAFADSGSPADPVGSLLAQVQQLAPSGAPSLSGLPAPSLPAPGLPTPSLPAPGLPGQPAAGTGSAGGASTGAAPSSDDDIAPNETTNPSGPDHAGTRGLHAAAAGQDVADAGQTRSTARRNNSTRADSTLLALGGQEILGAHASSTGKRESHAGNPLQPLCAGSGGQVCLQVLYADAYATHSGGTSHARSRNGVADVCLGGTHTDPAAGCDGPVHAGVLTNNSTINRNQHGRTRASSHSDLATVCLTQPGSTGCTLAAGALHSQGRADSGAGSRNSAPTAKRGSYLLGVQGGGQDGRVDPPASIQIPPGCPTSKAQAPSAQGPSAQPPNVLCGYLNQGETYLGKGLAGHAQDALKAGLLPGQPIEVDVLGGHTETLVHHRGVAAAQPPSGVSGVSAGGPGHPATGTVAGESALAPLAGLLPNTGGPWSGLLALALLGISAGSFLLAASERCRPTGRHLA